MLHLLSTTALLTLVAGAAWSDVRWNSIPNPLTLSALLLGLVLSAAGGLAPLLSALAACGIALALGLPLFGFRLLGGGDVKLLVAVSAFLGMERLPAALLLSGIAGALLALVVALRRGVLLPALVNSRDLLLWRILPRPASAVPVEVCTTGVMVPYGVAIGAGAVAAWLL